ncbi:stage II sporulation protein D [Ornithinibacillus gellani]|uniref:stage II sporulation protein D n=1 Tax=Ornithinibacillus gellani TaxID=2293253 RepID=UPI001CC1F84D|nr:stage II sporulation protein D [Ornithinibacillus gellani]
MKKYKSSLNKKQRPLAQMLKKKKRFHRRPKIMHAPFSNRKLGPKRGPRWQIPSVMFFMVMAFVMLILPSVIVIPFITNEKVESGMQEKMTPASKEAETDLGEAVSVAVMRTKSEKVENVPLESYVAGVVASEMPTKFELEALKAQALAARTFVVNHLIHQQADSSDYISDSVQHQVYKNEEELRKTMGDEFQKGMQKIKEAVAATEGQILTFQGKPIHPAYFSTSNGYTENSEDYWDNKMPYLRSVKSPWDEKVSPKFLDQVTYSIEEVATALGIELSGEGAISFEATRTKGQRIKALTIAGETFTGREIREKLQLRSSDFTIKQKNNHLIFRTKGYGHGIGMSQYGANGMALEGKSYEEIVKYYYQDVEISTVDSIAPALAAK